MSCWICIQKARWRREKKQAAIQRATDEANISRETMAIIKEGANYRVVKHTDAGGRNVVKIISGLK